MVYLWRAVDHDGEILESYVTKTRDKKASLTFMRKALKRRGKAEANGARTCERSTHGRVGAMLVDLPHFS